MEEQNKKKNTILWSCAIFLMLLLAGIAAVPSILSTQGGTHWLINQVNRRIKGSISIDRLALNWLTKQSIYQLQIKDAQGNEIISCEKVQIGHSIFSLLFQSITKTVNVANTTLLAPHLRLDIDKEGQLNLEKALSGKEKTSSKKSSPWQLTMGRGKFSLSQGELYLTTATADPITVADVNISIEDHPDRFELSAVTRQGAAEGTLSATGRLGKQPLIDIHVKQFPLALFDQLKGNALFTEGLGKTLNLDAVLTKNEQTIACSVTLETPNSSGSFKGKSQDGVFVLESGGEFVFSLSPAFFKQVIQASAVEKWHLANKADLALHVENLSFPLTLKDFDFRKILFKGSLSLDRAEIVHEQLGHFSLNHFTGTLQTADDLELTYTGQIQSNAGPTYMEGSMTLNEQGKLSYALNWKGFPLDLFLLTGNETAPLKPFIGSTFDLISQGSYWNKEVDIGFDIHSSQIALKGKVQGEYKDSLTIACNGEFLLPTRFAPYLGPSPQFNLHAQGQWSHENFFLPHVKIVCQNAYWVANIRGKIGEKGVPFSLEHVQLELDSTARQLPLEKQNVLIEEGRVFAQIDGAKNRIDAQATLQCRFHGSPDVRTLEAKAEVTHFIRDGSFDFEGSELVAQGTLPHFPTGVFDAYLGREGQLPALIGPFVDIKLEASYLPAKKESPFLTVNVKGQEFSSTFSLILDDTLKIAQDKPALFHWGLTPARYQSLMHFLHPNQEPGFVLTRTAALDLSISQFLCPASSGTTVSAFLSQCGFGGEFKMGPLHFKSRFNHEELILLGFTAFVEGESFSKAIFMHGKGKMISPIIPESESSSFSFNSELIGFFTEQGVFNRNGTIKGELNLDLIPVKELTSVIPLDERDRKTVQALLGPFVNARIQGELSQMHGPLTVDIKSSNLKALLPIYVHEGVITLRKTVELEITLTDAINELFLSDVMPFLITGAWSDHPLRVYIDSEGFSFPFHPFSLRAAHIEQAIIDLGKIRVRNGGHIQTLMNFLKAKEVSPEGVMEAWFTPIFATLNDGVASYKRFDALLGGNVHIAMWGRIDLNKDKVKMTLGISPDTLQERFNLKGLSNKEMFQVKMRGSTTNLELDWSSAYTRIGLIMARSAGGQLGNLIGGLIEGLIGAFGEENTPSPTTSPFPWEK